MIGGMDLNRRDMKKILSIAVLMAFAIYSLPIIAEAVEFDEKEFKGEANIFEKVKPDSPPGQADKPPKPGDDDDEPNTNVDKWAVVIGIADYYGIGNDLKYTDDDAKDMYKYLISQGYPSGNIKYLIDSQATAQNIIDAINWMDNLEGSDSECVFFYSGHGSTYDGYDDGDSEYTDEAIISYEGYGILDGTLASEFSTFSSNKIGIMFDSCFSGGMDDMAGSGRVFSAACGETQYSYDGTARMKNGVWTYYFMQGLKTYDAIEPAHDYAAPLASGFISSSYGWTMTPFMDDQYTGDWQF